MLILIEWHKNISVKIVACIVKHADPQITVYEGCLISSRPKVEADVLYSWKLACLQIYSIDENTESLKL